MGTTPVESVVSAGTIFLGQVTKNKKIKTTEINIRKLTSLKSLFLFCFQAECLILVRPYISKLTLSEIHALMTVGLAGVSGTMLAAYISLGVRSRVFICLK